MEPYPTLSELNASLSGTLMEALGIRYTLATPGRVEGEMPVDGRTSQPFGVLHGGASLALAETLAGLGGSLHCAAGEVPLGMQVSAQHVGTAPLGAVVRGVATPIHLGRTTQVWNVDILLLPEERLLSTVRVTNAIRKKK